MNVNFAFLLSEDMGEPCGHPTEQLITQKGERKESDVFSIDNPFYPGSEKNKSTSLPVAWTTPVTTTHISSTFDDFYFPVL